MLKVEEVQLGSLVEYIHDNSQLSGLGYVTALDEISFFVQWFDTANRQ
jgi:hypothetical protein